MLNFIRYKNIFLGASMLLLIASISVLAIFGLKLSIEFTGGTIMDIEYAQERPSQDEIKAKISDLNIEDLSIYTVEDKSITLRMKEIDETTHGQLLEKLEETGDFKEMSFETIGPVIGHELASKMQILIGVSLLAILIYMAIAFRNVPGPISSWRYGLVSLLILSHDIVLVLGLFAILGKQFGVQVSIPVVTALLTVVGYAINNVVVVYDRSRENLMRDRRGDYNDIINRSINQTLSRQVNTSLTTLLPLIAIYVLAGESLKYFSLALIAGIVFGLYSSIFLASPMLVLWSDWMKRNFKK